MCLSDNDENMKILMNYKSKKKIVFCRNEHLMDKNKKNENESRAPIKKKNEPCYKKNLCVYSIIRCLLRVFTEKNILGLN
jgi:hypothetical protein